MLCATLLAVAYAPWKDPRIHNFGNHGWLGRIHASVAPFATRLIDHRAYKGYDVRQLLKENAPLGTIDLGCGVGMSTCDGGLGVDASDAMLAVARARMPRTSFVRGLAETWGSSNTYPRVTISFLLHEQPQRRRQRILRNALRIATQDVLVMDIHPSYKPSFMMKTGEPYVEDYLIHIEQDIDALGVDYNVTYHCDDHVILFRLDAS